MWMNFFWVLDELKFLGFFGRMEGVGEEEVLVRCLHQFGLVPSSILNGGI